MSLSAFTSAAPGVPRWRRRMRLALAAAGLLMAGLALGEPPMPPTADEVKAAYVHRFAGFVEWPAEAFASPETSIVVGVVGSVPIQQALTRIVSGRAAQGRAFEVREITDLRSAAEVHMLVIGRGGWKRVGDWVGAARGHPVLVITDMAQGLERGAMLSFVESDSRLRFEASVPAAERVGLRLSARLLSVAERVVRQMP